MRRIASVTIVVYAVANGVPLVEHPADLDFFFYDNDHLDLAKDVYRALLSHFENNQLVIELDSREDDKKKTIFEVLRGRRIVQLRHPTNPNYPKIMLQYEEFKANYTIDDISETFAEKYGVNTSKNSDATNVVNLFDYKNRKR